LEIDGDRDDKSDNESSNDEQSSSAEDTEKSTEDLSQLTVKDLREECIKRKLKGYSSLKKSELVNLLIGNREITNGDPVLCACHFLSQNDKKYCGCSSDTIIYDLEAILKNCMDHFYVHDERKNIFFLFCKLEQDALFSCRIKVESDCKKFNIGSSNSSIKF